MTLILERTSDDGVLYCEHSGKPLVHNYDIVAHHKIPLTMSNVNDFNISLNPENILIVSQSAHNEIHGRFGYLAERKVYYVYGAPCAGKTTFVRGIKGNSDIVLDMDSIWQCITGGDRYEKPNALKTNAFIIRDAMTDMIKTRSGRWEKAFVIEGGARKAERERKIALLGAEPIYIDTDKETCLKRLASDENRTDFQKVEWAKYINEWFEEFED
jgi:shikimate kinase